MIRNRLVPVDRRHALLRAAGLILLGLSTYWSIRVAWTARDPTTATDPENPDLYMQLGQHAELAGDLALAERSLLRAAAISRLHQPRYLLTQFYFRHPDGDGFRTWSRRALETAYGDTAPLLDLAWRSHPDAAWLWENSIPHRPYVARQYLGFLMARHRIPRRRHRRPRPGRPRDFRRPPGAPQLVRSAARRRRASRCARRLARTLPPQTAPLRPDTLITNADFTEPPLGTGFDWRPAGTPGVTTSIDRGRLHLAFTGTQPEQCTLLWQYLNLEPDAHYEPDQGTLRWPRVESRADVSARLPASLRLPPARRHRRHRPASPHEDQVTLLALLFFAILTMWMEPRWAWSFFQIGIFLLAAQKRTLKLDAPVIVLAVAALCPLIH